MRACIERVVANRVGGWAYNDNDISERLLMRLVLDGEVIAEARADKYRNDLKLNGLGDGHYGFDFTDVAKANLAAAFQSGRIEIRAIAKADLSVVAQPAHYLHQHVEGFLRVQALDSSNFADVLESAAHTGSVDPESAGSSLGFLNASRAHFPEWRSSIEFLQIAVALAARASRPHSLRFYEDRLRLALDIDTASQSNLTPMEAAPRPEVYGSLVEWSETRAGVRIEIVTPRFFKEGNPESFLQEVGILKSDPEQGSKVQVLAFREYAFGEPSWWVNRQGIPARVARSLYYLDFEILRSVLDGGGFVLIDMSNEGPPADPDWISVLNSALIELQVDPRQVILVTQNLRFGMAPSDGRFLGHIADAHFFISKSINVLKNQLSTEAQLRQHCSSILSNRRLASDEVLKHYVCLNFTPRWSRWATVLHLSANGLLDRGYVSFPGSTNYKMQRSVDLERDLPQLSNRSELLRHAPQFIERCPLELDIPGSASASPDFVYPITLTTGSLFHIVTESEMSDGEHRLRVTEKILKPIVGLQPFIVAGNPGSLSLLRNMGFRTFGSLIDEGYDLIADPARRLDAVLQQIDILANRPINSLRKAVEELSETLVHNFLHLMLVGPLLFNTSVEHRLRNLMGRIKRI